MYYANIKAYICTYTKTNDHKHELNFDYFILYLTWTLISYIYIYIISIYIIEGSKLKGVLLVKRPSQQSAIGVVRHYKMPCYTGQRYITSRLPHWPPKVATLLKIRPTRKRISIPHEEVNWLMPFIDQQGHRMSNISYWVSLLRQLM